MKNEKKNGNLADNKPPSPASRQQPKDVRAISQREKFIQTAREIGCDESGEALDKALRAIGRARKR